MESSSNSPRENSFNTCENMLLYFKHRLSILRLNWFFRNPIQRIRGSTSHRQRRPPLRPEVSPPIWTALTLDRPNLVSSPFGSETALRLPFWISLPPSGFKQSFAVMQSNTIIDLARWFLQRRYVAPRMAQVPSTRIPAP